MPTEIDDAAVRPGRLVRIWSKRFRGGPMDEIEHGELVRGRGLVGSANQGGKRQLTLISVEAWRRMEAELDSSVDPRLRRANLLVEGVELAGTTGRVLGIAGCRLLVHGETRPCRRMEESHPGLLAGLVSEWRGGVYGEILDGGRITGGDTVVWEE